jgi:hypothetical protein
MMNKRLAFILGLLLVLAPASGFADKIGDAAPSLNVDKWVKGKALDVKDGKNIYIVQFCSLSRANDMALTNLNHLQKKYKGVIAITVSDEPAAQLEEFVKLKADKIEYAVAADNDNKTTLSYLRAFNQMALPRAFVVGKEGKVLWHGHPLGGLDDVLDEITSGRYSEDRMRKSIEGREQLEQYLLLARKEDEQGTTVGLMLLSIRTNDWAGLCDLAFRIATDPYLPKRDVALANKALDRAEQIATTNASSVSVARSILLFQTGKEQEGLALAKKALASAQSQKGKDEAQACIRTMEFRLRNDKASPSNAPAAKP